MTDPLLQLTSTIGAQLEQLSAVDPDMLADLIHLRESVREALPRSYQASQHSYAPLVKRAIETARGCPTHQILERLSPVQASLPWRYHYARRTGTDELDGRIAFAELIGPEGPLWAPDCRVGFTVLAEQTVYPMHSHPAVELYLVLAGTARWSTPSRDRRVPPGDLVLHRSGESHAMCSFGDPLLALWGWRGDIDSPAAYD